MLLVEDNNNVAEALLAILEEFGSTTVRASSGAAALALLQEQATLPDVVLSDVAMPGEIDGLALALRLEASHPTLSVVLMTGYAERISDIEAKGCSVLPKPCPVDVLRASLA